MICGGPSSAATRPTRAEPRSGRGSSGALRAEVERRKVVLLDAEGASDGAGPAEQAADDGVVTAAEARDHGGERDEAGDGEDGEGLEHDDGLLCDAVPASVVWLQTTMTVEPRPAHRPSTGPDMDERRDARGRMPGPPEAPGVRSRPCRSTSTTRRRPRSAARSSTRCFRISPRRSATPARRTRSGA